MQHLASNITENSLAGMYATVALAANGKAKYGYNPKSTRIENGYRQQNQSEYGELVEPLNFISNNNLAYQIYPNPAKDNISVNFANDLPDYFEILDVAGKVIRKYNTINKLMNISLTDVAEGLYFIKTSNNLQLKKLVVIK